MRREISMLAAGLCVGGAITNLINFVIFGSGWNLFFLIACAGLAAANITWVVKHKDKQ